jgi:hypothetical protein
MVENVKDLFIPIQVSMAVIRFTIDPNVQNVLCHGLSLRQKSGVCIPLPASHLNP